MRTNNSIKNTIWSIIFVTVGVLASFISQTIFLKYLGVEYLGINGLLGNLISSFGLIELGLGSAITYFLYKPFANNDKIKINQLLRFYKKSYIIISGIILLLGLLLLPFINVIVGDVNIDYNVKIIFMLFVIDAIFLYLITYKRVILVVDQKNYIINIIRTIYIILLNIIQILILIYTRNYLIYLSVKIILRIIENIVITIYINNKYKYIKEKNIDKIDDDTKKSVFEKIKSMSFHKVGNFIVTNTDNIIITQFIGIVYVGFYYNYLLIINALMLFFSQISLSITPIVGNFLVKEDKSKFLDVYKKIEFINFYVTTIVCTLLLCLVQPFIVLWIGSEYLLTFDVVIILCINLYLNLYKRGMNIFKEAAGLFSEDKFMPILEAIINLILSIIFIQLFGIFGVFLGTSISTLFILLYSFPKYAYNKLFNKPKSEYILKFISRSIVFLVVILATYYISNIIVFDNVFVHLFILLVISSLVSISLLSIIFIKNNEFKFFVKLVKNKFLRIK